MVINLPVPVCVPVSVPIPVPMSITLHVPELVPVRYPPLTVCVWGGVCVRTEPPSDPTAWAGYSSWYLKNNNSRLIGIALYIAYLGTLSPLLICIQIRL